MQKIIREFFSVFKTHPWWAVLFVLMILISSVFHFVDPFVFKLLVDSFVAVVSQGQGDAHALLWLAFMWFLANSALQITMQVRDFAFYTLMNYHWLRVVADTFTRMLRKDIGVFNSYKTGYILEAYSNGMESRWSINYKFVNYLSSSFLSFFIIVTVGFFVSWQLTLTMLCIIPFQLVISYAGYRYTKPFADKNHRLWSRAFGIAGDSLQNVHAVKSYAAEKHEVKRLRGAMAKAIDLQFIINRAWMYIHSIDIRTISLFAIFGVGAFLVVGGKATIGTVLMFRILTRYILDPVKFLAQNMNAIQKDISRHEIFEEILHREQHVLDSAGSHSHKGVAGHYVLDGVSFSHGKRKTLKNISMEIGLGEKVALVGPSGAGKSTLALLLARFYDPDKGSIMLDGVELWDWDYDALRSHLAMVWQENMLFHESLKFNIEYGKRHSSDRDVMRAVREAQLGSFVKGQPKGLGTLVGERGIRLSGGEKQRVMIARALLKNPDIVILDEATSALDSMTEREVQEGIEKLISGKTAVIIAHRLSTIMHCDRIFVMDNGRIVARGTHTQLLKTSPLYKEMVTLQSHGMLHD